MTVVNVQGKPGIETGLVYPEAELPFGISPKPKAEVQLRSVLAKETEDIKLKHKICPKIFFMKLLTDGGATDNNFEILWQPNIFTSLLLMLANLFIERSVK